MSHIRPTRYFERSFYGNVNYTRGWKTMVQNGGKYKSRCTFSAQEKYTWFESLLKVRENKKVFGKEFESPFSEKVVRKLL